MIASFVGYSISEEMQIQFIVIGIGISGLVGIFLPDNLKAEKEGEIKLTENEVIEQKLKQIEGVDEDFKNATRQRTFEETGFNDRTFIPVNSRFTPNSKLNICLFFI